MLADAILENFADGMPAEEISEVFELPVDAVRPLLAYAAHHDSALKPRGHAWMALSEPAFAAVWGSPEDDVYNAL